MAEGNEVVIDFRPENANPAAVQAALGDANNYQFFEAADLAKLPSEVAAISALPDAAQKEMRLAQLARRLQTANLVNTSVPPRCERQCTLITLTLKQPYKLDTAYVVTVAGVDIKSDPPKFEASGTRLDLKLTNKAAIVPSVDSARLREEVRVVAPVPLRANSALAVESKHIELSPEGNKTQVTYRQRSALGVKQDPAQPNELTVGLAEKLEESRSHVLEIRKITDAQGNALRGGLYDLAGNEVTASGKFDIPGQPAPPGKPTVDVKLSGDVGAHQKPLFDLKANYAPIPFPRSDTSQWTWEPTGSLEVGIGKLKSSNSIIIDAFRFTRYFNLCKSGERDEETEELSVYNKCRGDNFPEPTLGPGEARTPVYYAWANAPWTRLSFVKFGFSPFRAEADRAFSRINGVVGARFDFLFNRLLWSIQDQRDLLSADVAAGDGNLKKEDLGLIQLSRGFRVVPYVALDFGRHLTTEKIEKDVTINGVKQKQTVFVPKHGIARGIVGTTALFQWRLFSQPMALTIDGHVLYLALEETVGFTNDEGAFLKPLRGIHHRGTASWDIYFDPAKHYSFNVSYENGRKAPNFEYLNKFTTGIKVVY
jgi:hypothetical protein